MSNHFRALPAVARVLEASAAVAARGRYPAAALATAVRHVLDGARASLAAGDDPGDVSADAIASRAVARLDADDSLRLRTVINAIGVVLHTNLGRAPLADVAARAAYDAGRTYLNLELDLETGRRGARQDAVRDGIRAVTGAAAATVANNCAAATVLALRALAAGREVIVSRGQLIEIGGGFRIPEIMATSGAVLREVGTTNITRLDDFERAIGPNTAVLMRVHTSNYRVRGFAKAVGLADLVTLGKKHNIPVIDDAGSGQAFDLTPFGLPGEPLVSAGIAAGADLVLFSGDKLLGGPQAGILAGRADLIARVEADPLMRAFRLDKMTLAALEATLRLYRDPERARREIPVLRMLTTPLADLRARSDAFAVRLRGAGVAALVREDVAYVGGGSLPDVAVPTAVIAVECPAVSEGDFATRLRTGSPAVVGRVQDGRYLIDLRTVFENQEDELLAAVSTAATARS